MLWDSNAESNSRRALFWPKLYFDQPDFVQLELSSTQCTQQVHDTPKEKLIWDSAKVDDKKEYWQKYREKEEEIELDKDEKISLIT